MNWADAVAACFKLYKECFFSSPLVLPVSLGAGYAAKSLKQFVLLSMAASVIAWVWPMYAYLTSRADPDAYWIASFMIFQVAAVFTLSIPTYALKIWLSRMTRKSGSGENDYT